MSDCGYHFQHNLPQVRLERLEFDEDEGWCSPNRCGGGNGNDAGGEESAAEQAFLSDDAGFYSADSQEEVEDEGMEEECRMARMDAEKQLEIEVAVNFPTLVERYCDQDVLKVKDPFQEVNFLELCMVLRMSAERCGLVISAQLLDITLQIFAKQVKLCYDDIVRVANELHRQDKHEGKKGGDRQQNKKGEGDNVADAFDEGYHSQPLSQPDEEEDDEESRRQSSLRTMKRTLKFVANEDQLINDFVKERSAHVVARRKILHEHSRQTIQHSYLDYHFDIHEYYEQTGELGNADMERLGHSAIDLFKALGRFTKSHVMENLYLPPRLFADDGDEEDNLELGGNDEDGMPMEVDVGGEGSDLFGNNENMVPLPLDVVLQEIGDADLVGQLENIAIISAARRLSEEGGENVPPNEKEKKKKRKRRVPFLEKQNLGEEGAVVPCDGESEAKRPRLDDDAASVPEPEQLQNQSLLHDGLWSELGSENLSVDCDAIAYPVMTSPPNDDQIYGAFDDLDLTAAECDGSFRPPSPLVNKDKSSLNYRTTANRVDMSAIKSKFNSVIHEATLESQMTFVEILQKSEMDIQIGPNESIPAAASFTTSPLEPTAPSFSAPVSVGVAFLAMLHNAAQGSFYLVEDPDGVFKVTAEKPADDDNLQQEQ